MSKKTIIALALIGLTFVFLGSFYASKIGYEHTLKQAMDTCYAGDDKACDELMSKLSPADRNYVDRSFKQVSPAHRGRLNK